MGRPYSIGSRHAIAMHSTCCSRVNFNGAPGRWLSSNRSINLLERSAVSTQRRRHFRTILILRSSVRAISALFFPRAASSTIRARCARSCGVLGRKANFSRSCWSVSLRVIVSGWQPMSCSVNLFVYTITEFTPQCTSNFELICASGEPQNYRVNRVWDALTLESSRSYLYTRRFQSQLFL